MALSKNDEIELAITGTTHDGSGVGHWEGLAVFVPGCAEGDTVRAHVLAVKKHLAYAKVLEILTPSPWRAQPDCPAFPRCGGCAFRHIRYEKELEIKHTRVRDALRKIGGLTLEPAPIVPSEAPDHYRNKAEYPVAVENGKLIAGFYARGSHRIVDAGYCLLEPELFERALGAFRLWAAETHISAYHEADGKGLLRHIYLRYAEGTGELMACAVVNGGSIPKPERLAVLLQGTCPGLKSLILNENTGRGNVILGPRCQTLWGADTITDFLCGLKIELSPLSFYQVNRRGAEKLYALAADWALSDGCGLLLDLYCGAGTIGLSMAGRAGKVMGVEIISAAVADARRNAARNDIRNAEFFCADAEKAALRLEAQGLRPDAVVVDPPRKGCSAATLEALCRMKPRRIAYVSCDPATLARDLALLAQHGYCCKKVTPVDMFPRTAHVECCCSLEKLI